MRGVTMAPTPPLRRVPLHPPLWVGWGVGVAHPPPCLSWKSLIQHCLSQIMLTFTTGGDSYRTV